MTNLEINLLSNDELDAVVGAGGKTNGETRLFTAFYDGIVSKLDQAGRNALADAFAKAQQGKGPQ
jgi:hypothetical protein